MVQKILPLLTLLIAGYHCTSTKALSTSGKLNGTWKPVKEEIGGKVIPAAAFRDQKLEISDSLYTMTAESVDRGVVNFGKTTLDVYGRQGPNAGRHIPAIYQLQDGLLTICYDLSGTAYPSSFETEGKPLRFLAVFQRSNL